MRRIVSAALALAYWQTGAQAQEAEEAPAPDLDFLEYLGAWAGDDDEWLVIEEWERGSSARREEGSDEPDEEKDDGDDGE
jgi:hypothetical protein